MGYFRGRNDSISIVAGTNLLVGGDEQVYESEYIAGHENFTMSHLPNDVAVIRVNRDIEFNDKVQPIELPAEDFTKVNYPVVLSGWGSTSVIIFF